MRRGRTQYASVREPFTPHRPRDGGPDHGESPVPARDEGTGFGSRAGGGAHCPLVVVSQHEEASGILRVAVDEPLDRRLLRRDQGPVEEHAPRIPRLSARGGHDAVPTADAWPRAVRG